MISPVSKELGGRRADNPNTARSPVPAESTRTAVGGFLSCVMADDRCELAALVERLRAVLSVLQGSGAGDTELSAWGPDLTDAAALHRDVGAARFRGYSVSSMQDFQHVLRAVTPQLLEYDYASTPRTRRGDGIYTSTEYPPHQSIPLHNEMSYSTRWPRWLWMCCLTPAESGGATPLADSREVYRRLDSGLVRRFERSGLLYVRNYGTGLDLSWQKAFSTDNKQAVEAYCHRLGIEFEWRAGGVLRTRQRCQAVVTHPVSQERIWFNQAHLFHVSALESDVREVLLEVVAPEDLPRNVYYGDGTPLEESALDEIRGVYDGCRFEFPWQRGDLLLVDNLRVAHGRTPFRGERTILVAMA